MTYKINKTDGNLLTEIPDGTFDTSATSITLIGKNVTAFGEALNENFVKMLENFSSSTAPEQPIKGQLWYDTGTGRLQVYDGTEFRASGGPLISAQTPTNLVSGDLWIDNNANQLWFYDGTDLILAGPVYTNQQGLSGFKVETVLDSLNRTRVITKLYSNNTLLGIFSNVAFTPLFPIQGFGSTVGVGFTAGTLSNLKFDVTVTKSESLVTEDGTVKTTADLLFNNEDSTIYGSLTVQSVDGLRLLGGDPGTNLSAQGDSFVKLEAGALIIENAESGRPVEIRTKRPIAGTTTSMYIDSVNQRVGFFNAAPTASVDITGDLKVSGDFIVGGDTVSINVTNLNVEDKNIELNKPASGSVTDTQANGGGIILDGDTNKTLLWVKQDPVSDSSWTSSENIDLVSGKVYKIAGTPVITTNSLGSGILSSSLTSLGQLTSLKMNAGLAIAGNTITGTGADLTLTSNTGNINVNNKNIINVPDLNYTTSPGNYAANKNYVDERVLFRPIALTFDVSEYDISTQDGLSDAVTEVILPTLNAISPVYINDILTPEGLAIQGTVAKIHIYRTEVTVADIVYSPVSDTTPNPGETYAYNTVPVAGTVNAQESVLASPLPTGQVIPAPAATVSVVRMNLKFVVNSSPAWEYVGVIA